MVTREVAVLRPSAMAMLQWSHGRLTVVTPNEAQSYNVDFTLQWSHGRLTVVTQVR